MFRIGQVLAVEDDKTITVVCPEIAGTLQFQVKPMRVAGTWRTPRPGSNVVIFGERNNYLYAGMADDANTYDSLITYLGSAFDGVPDHHIPLWELLKVSLAWLYKALDPVEGHVHEIMKTKIVVNTPAGPGLIEPVPGLSPTPEVGPPMGSDAAALPEYWPRADYVTEHDEKQKEVDEDGLVAEMFRVEGNPE